MLEKPSDSDQIVRGLKQLDQRLFLEKQLTLDGEQVWTVHCAVEGDQPPICVFEWRDPDGRPIPVLSSGIIDRMAAMERDPAKLNAKVKAKNAEFERRRDEKFNEHIYGISEERRRSLLSHSVLHRSPGLAAARRRQRQQGHNV